MDDFADHGLANVDVNDEGVVTITGGDTPAADGWCDWSGRADAEAQAASVLDEVGKALAKNDPGLAKGTLARNIPKIKIIFYILL